MIELTTPSLCDIEQYISPESITYGTYIKPVAMVLCLGNLVHTLVPSRSHIAKTMFKSNNSPPNNKYKSNWMWWTQNESFWPPIAQDLPQWSSFNVKDQEKPTGYPKPQNQPRSDSKRRMTYCRWTSWCLPHAFGYIIYMHTYSESLWRFRLTLLQSNIVTSPEVPKAASGYTHIQRISLTDVNSMHEMSWRCSFHSLLKKCTSYGCRWCWRHDSKGTEGSKGCGYTARADSKDAKSSTS